MCEDSRPDYPPDLDREIHIEAIKRELDRISNGTMIHGGSGEVSPALEENFLERVLTFELASSTPLSIDWPNAALSWNRRKSWMHRRCPRS
jgi:hypothetical protein